MMKPPQVRKLLERAGLTQVAAAQLIGVTTRQMHRYTSGETAVPRPVELALLYVTEQRQKEAE